MNNRRTDCCVKNGDSAIDIAVNDSLKDVVDIKATVCIGDQTLEYGECVDPVCPNDKKVVDKSCVSYLSGIFIFLISRRWV
jgi:hypothetical protein